MNRALLLVLLLAPSALAQGGPPPLQPPPVPPQNPITPEKAVLGKILFWDEQLASDHTVACGSCHFPTAAGAETRVARHPGRDGRINTPDDVFGSPGVVRNDAARRFEPDPVFGLDRQITGRNAPGLLMAAYAPRLFWDGRAQGPFLDPLTNVTLIPLGGALEIQVLAPPTSDVEMAHEGRNWSQVAARIGAAVPLRLATNLPGDVAAALAGNATYPDLFRRAFGDPAVTPARIAFAIATYERTLVPNQAPVDRNQLTPAQQRGRGVFLNEGGCAVCHTGPQFSDNQFHNTGLRPLAEDTGRQAITGNPADAGRFKTPTLRNAGLKRRFQHNGVRTTLEEVVDFYIRGGDFPANRDPAMQPRPLTGPQRTDLLDFLRNGLTDPRVAQGVAPFDRPTLHGERFVNGQPYGQGSAGTGGAVPRVLGHLPAFRGNDAFQIGIAGGLGGSPAVLAIALGAANLQVGGIPILVDPLTVFVLQVLPSLSGPALGGQGFTTLPMPIPNDPLLTGDFTAQWFVVDPAGAQGIAASHGARFTIF